MPRKLTDAEREDIKEVFYLYDDDESGNINVKELPTLLRYLGFNPTQAQCNELMVKYDKNKDKSLDFKEFLTLCETEELPPSDSEDDLRAAFNIFDKDGSGYLTFNELKAALTTRGEAMTDEEVKRMLKGFDDGDGKLSFEEFVRLMKGETNKPAEPAPAAAEAKPAEPAPAAAEAKPAEPAAAEAKPAEPAAAEAKPAEPAPAAAEAKPAEPAAAEAKPAEPAPSS